MAPRKMPLTTSPILTKGRKPMASAANTMTAVVCAGVQAEPICRAVSRRVVISDFLSARLD